MHLNNARLELIYELIKNENRKFKCMADVGTDHAYLPVYAVQQGTCLTAIASDVNPLPLKRATENIKKYRLSDKIQLLLSDGLCDYPSECDVVCIAGLSGSTIISILEKYLLNPWRVNPMFVLQPNTDVRKTREFLIKNGFSYQDEQVCLDKKHEYPIIKGSFRSGGKLQEIKNDILFYHLGLFTERNDEQSLSYLKRIYEKYILILNKITTATRDLQLREETIISEYKEVTEYIKNKINIQK